MENIVNWSISFLSESLIELPLLQEDTFLQRTVSKLSVKADSKESSIKIQQFFNVSFFHKHGGGRETEPMEDGRQL